jgi:hypothetical protein
VTAVDGFVSCRKNGRVAGENDLLDIGELLEEFTNRTEEPTSVGGIKLAVEIVVRGAGGIGGFVTIFTLVSSYI